jgi:hypothetical protein
MKGIFLYSSIVLGLLASCSSEVDTTTPQESENVEQTPAEELDPDWSGLAILDGGFKLGIEIPNENIAHGTSEVIFHEDLGELEVKVGPNFDLFILEDESQIEMVKNELNDHAFYKVEYALSNDSSLLYRQYTESGEKEQWHCYAERNIGASKIIVRSNEAIPFTEYQAKLMLQSALSISPF